MKSNEIIAAAELAADTIYHEMYDMGAPLEDCVNRAKNAYKGVCGEEMKNVFDFFGIDEEEWEEVKDL